MLLCTDSTRLIQLRSLEVVLAIVIRAQICRGKISRAKISGLLLLFCSALMTSPAFAQLDLSGTWNPQYQEDQPERIPGPELVDYLGIPINAAARQWALSWDPDRLGLPGASVPGSHRCLYLSRSAGASDLGRTRSGNSGTDCDPAVHQHLRAEPHYLYGWPPASPRVCGSHLDGILDRVVGRQHPYGLHYAHQTGLAPAERHPL